MRPAAIITGTGLVTPLGGDVESTWQALLAGGAIRDHARAAAGALPAGSRLTDESGVYKIAHRAAVAAVGKNLPDALLVGTSKGEADAWIADGSLPIAGIGNLASRLGDALRIAGPRLTISAACASGLQALIRGVLLIVAGDAERVLVVAAESSLHPMFLENYRRLGVLAPEGAGCRPFDQGRQGFCLSEAAAAVMLESDDWLAGRASDGGPIGHEAPTRQASPPSLALPANQDLLPPPAGAFPKIAIESFAFGSDATHLTGADPTGRPMRNLLRRVMAGRRFDLIHAHGTGTVANDAIELAALESVLADDAGPAPLVYSHKAALGHSLGASGLASVVLNVQMHRAGIVPGNVNTPNPLPTRHVSVCQHPESRPVHRSVALAAGFGGALAAVSLRTLE